MKGSLVLALVLASATGCKSKPRLLHVFLAGPGVAVTRDMVNNDVVLTSRDLTAKGATIATRTFSGTTSVLCETLPRERLLCELEDGEVQILDARTLVDQEDIKQLIMDTFPDAQVGAEYANFLVHPNGSFDVPIADDEDARVDLATKTITRVVAKRPRGIRGRDPERCIGYRGGTIHNGLFWEIDSGTLFRKRPVVEAEPAATAEAEITPIPSPIHNGSVMNCGSFTAGVLVMSYSGNKSQVARLDDEARVRWIADLGAHPGDLFVVGDQVLVPTSEIGHRLISIDLATGTTRWVIRE